MSEKKNKGGRPKGSKSEDLLAYQEFFVKKKFVIPEKELWVLEEAKSQYEDQKEKEHNGRISLMESRAQDYLKIYQNQLRDIASRIYPKLKSLDTNLNISSDDAGFKIIVQDYVKKDEK